MQESNNCTVQCDKKTVQSRYKDVGDYEDIKITFQKALDSCGDKSANKKMNLVFFHDALEHATRIHRVFEARTMDICSLLEMVALENSL